MKKSIIKNEVPEPCALCALKCYEHKVHVRIPLEMVKNTESGTLNKRMLNTLINLCASRQLRIIGMAPIPSQN